MYITNFITSIIHFLLWFHVSILLKGSTFLTFLFIWILSLVFNWFRSRSSKLPLLLSLLFFLVQLSGHKYLDCPFNTSVETKVISVHIDISMKSHYFSLKSNEDM